MGFDPPAGGDIDPVEYHDTAADNIAFGDMAAHPTQEEIEQAAVASGAAVSIGKLPQAYETMLGKWFGDAELSVGEWQRIALARAIVIEHWGQPGDWTALATLAVLSIEGSPAGGGSSTVTWKVMVIVPPVGRL